MLNRSRSILVSVGLFLPMLLAMTEYDAGAQLIKVRIIIEKGSVWSDEKGQQLIRKEITEARRIWFANVGVKIHIPDQFEMVGGNPDAPITKKEIEKYAQTHGAKVDDIVVVCRNKSVGVSRAWTEPSLVNSDTPVIIVGKKVFEKPGTKRDLAHELGHVLLRDEGHIYVGNNLMNQGPDVGDYLSSEQAEKARRYPANK